MANLDKIKVGEITYDIQDSTARNTKQDALVSGSNIKTINGESLLGSGDIAITGNANITVDSVITADSTNPVQSKAIYNNLKVKQDTLVSGTNIKTVNGQSLLGSGDITVSGETSGTKLYRHHITYNIKENGKLIDDSICAANVILISTKPDAYMYDVAVESNDHAIVAIGGEFICDSVRFYPYCAYWNNDYNRWQVIGREPGDGLILGAFLLPQVYSGDTFTDIVTPL